MKHTLAVQIVGGGAVCLALLGVTTGAAFPQAIGSENPRAAPAEAPAPAPDCQPIGLTASGEAVFPFQCKDFIKRKKNASQKNAPEGNQKPTVADKKPDVTKEKTGAKQKESAAPENSKPAPETVGTVPSPQRVMRERIVGPPGCMRFHSYDAASGTYRSYDRRRRPCREVTSTAIETKDGPPALPPDSSKAPPQSTGSVAAVDSNVTSANTADPRSTVDVDTGKIEGADAAPATTPTDSSKAPLPSTGSIAAADTNVTSANTADPRSAADVDTRKTEAADAAPATTAPDSSKALLQSEGSAAAADTKATSANIAGSRSTADVDTRKAESADAAPATTPTEHATVATAASKPDMKGTNTDNSDPTEMSARGDVEKTASASANATDLLVAVRPDITSVSGLTGKTIAIDEKYSESNGSVRIAIVAAGASEIELSAGQTTAISRLRDGEVPAAILALVPADAAEGFPEIAGFKILRIPLSPRS